MKPTLYRGRVTLGSKKLMLSTFLADYVCAECEKPLVAAYRDGIEALTCPRCGDATDVIHRGKIRREQVEYVEAVEALRKSGGNDMLKDRDRVKPRRLARAGTIRLGHKEKRKTKDGREYEYPVQDDHFVLTDAPEIAEVYGVEPTTLDIMLPFSDIERNFDAHYTVWAGGVLVCKGNGEFVEFAAPMNVTKKAGKNGKETTHVYNASGDTLVVDGVAQSSFDWGDEHFDSGDTVPCPGAAAGMYPQCASCKISAILKMLMADPRLFRLSYYQLATGSGSNYDNILGALELIRGDSVDPITGEKRYGTRPVSGVPFKLSLVKRQITYTDDTGKRSKTEKFFLQLEPSPDYVRAALTSTARSAFGFNQPQLPAPDPILEDDEFDDFEPEAPPPFAEAQAQEIEVIDEQDDNDYAIIVKGQEWRAEDMSDVQLDWVAGKHKDARAREIAAAEIERRELEAIDEVDKITDALSDEMSNDDDEIPL